MFRKNNANKEASSADLDQTAQKNTFIPVKEPKGGFKIKTKRSKNPFKELSKKQKIIAGILTVTIIFGGAFGVFLLNKEEPKPAPVVQKVEEPKPAKTTEASRLTGIEVPLENNKKTATGIMIENSPDARPQSGLKEAGVIYEAVAEGGITRFMGVFQDDLPTNVGPVRSVRPYYLDFITPYDAGIAHVGGSGQALSEIANQGLKDLDQSIYGHDTSVYWRNSARYAPHNMYTNLLKLKEVEAKKSWTSNYEGFVRGGEDKAVEAPNAKAINIRMSSHNYNVAYQYDQASNSYLRSEGGKPHMDATSNTQLSPKVLIVPIVTRTQNGIYSVYALDNGGKVLVFQNGTVIEGTWSKAGRKSQFKFTGADGQPLKLAPGQTWVTLAAAASDVTFTP